MTIQAMTRDVNTEAGVVAELTEAALTPQTLYEPEGGTPIVGWDGHVVDTEKYASAPDYSIADVRLHGIESLVRYGYRFYSDETVAYLNESAMNLTVVLSDDHPNRPSWRRHRARVDLEYTEDWNRWMGSHEKRMDQPGFSGFLEDNALAIVDPVAADILELVQNFEQTMTTTFKSSTRLQSGLRRLTFQEDGVAEKSVTVPETFRIGVPVFRGIDQSYLLTARLKFRARNGELMFWYELMRPDLVIEAAVNDIEDRFITAHEGVAEYVPTVLRGEAPPAR